MYNKILNMQKTPRHDQITADMRFRSRWSLHLNCSPGLVKVLCAEIIPQSDFIWQEVIKNIKDIESEKNIIDALLNDTEKLIALFRLVAQRTKKEPYLESFERAK